MLEVRRPPSHPPEDATFTEPSGLFSGFQGALQVNLSKSYFWHRLPADAVCFLISPFLSAFSHCSANRRGRVREGEEERDGDEEREGEGERERRE